LHEADAPGADGNIGAMLKKTLYAAVLVLIGAVLGLALHTSTTRGETMFAGKRPANLGLTDGRLAPPRKTPNCVSSQADPADAEHAIAPIPLAGTPVEAMAVLRGVIEGMERVQVIRHEQDYLYAEFKSRLMGYVDDVEFHASAVDGVIHVRSASRLGRRDFGVNRQRVEAIRERFLSAQRATLKA
jgi:uncharacterized protein (DUF1499 family)